VTPPPRGCLQPLGQLSGYPYPCHPGYGEPVLSVAARTVVGIDDGSLAKFHRTNPSGAETRSCSLPVVLVEQTVEPLASEHTALVVT
jgi:hypothetical protein